MVQHQLGCRAATRVLIPEAIPPERLERYGVRPPAAPLPGPEGGVLPPTSSPIAERYSSSASTRRTSSSSCGRRRTSPCTTASRTRSSRGSWTDWDGGGRPDRRHPAHGRATGAHPGLAPLDRRARRRRRRPEPHRLLDLVVSAGRTMNREAVALGVPVFTTFGGRLGGVDEWLIREGRLRPLEDPDTLELAKRSGDRAHAPQPSALPGPAPARSLTDQEAGWRHCRGRGLRLGRGRSQPVRAAQELRQASNDLDRLPVLDQALELGELVLEPEGIDQRAGRAEDLRGVDSTPRPRPTGPRSFSPAARR